MNERRVTHSTFVIERFFDASPPRVFAAFANRETKLRWFNGPADWKQERYELDFRVGGKEHNGGGPKGGPMHRYDAVYQDIVENERIVTTYQMHMDDALTSVSVATFEFKPDGKGTRLVLTEQGAFLDGYDNEKTREGGTRELLEKLSAFLAN